MEIARVRARNTAPDSENRMHDDETAAAYGFRGGLVPGVTVYGYMAVPLGAAFLEHGGLKLRLLRPFYDGDEVIIQQPGDTIVQARNSDDEVCATGTFTQFQIPRLETFAEAPLPDPRPLASPDVFTPGRTLGAIRRTPAAPSAEFLLELSNRVLMENVKLGPWIHAASDVQHFSLARQDEPLSVRANVKDRFEKAGHRFVVLDVVVLGDDHRLIQYVTHTAIYEPAQRR